MTNYPSPQERSQIIARRRQLMDDLISVVAGNKPGQQKRQMKRLVKKYGTAEVERMVEIFQRRMPDDPEDDEAMLYQQYLDNYRRFGRQRPFLDPEAYDEADTEFVKLYGPKLLGQTLSQAQQRRLDELTDILFKDAIFWEDITPEDPPPTMPDVDFDAYKVSRPPARMQLSGDSAPICKEHGFPRLRIGGRLECVAEYLDSHIGQREIVDVVRRGPTTYYVFEDGHKLPLLCPCCNNPLQLDSLARERKNVVGRRLESMDINTNSYEDGTEVDELVLLFSKKGRLSRRLAVPVAFEVAVELQHPAPPPKRQVKKKRRARRKRRKK